MDKLEQHKIPAPRLDFITLGLTVLCCVAVFFFALITARSADDFWYSTFWDKGLAHFLEMTSEHYETFNGRVFVHIVAQSVLHFGNWLFALFSLLVVGGIPLAATALRGTGRRERLFVSAIFLGGFLAMPTAFLTEGVWWASGFCNYVFPTLMLVLQVAVLEGTLDASPSWRRLCGVTALLFLCGATTEQSGATAVGVSIIFLIIAVVRRKNVAAFAAGLVSSVLGLLTVFLSPATASRVDGEIGEAASLTESLTNGLETQAEYIMGSANSLILLLLVFMAAALYFASRKNTAPFVLSLLFLCTVAVMALIGPDIRTAAYLAALFGLLVLAVFLVIRKSSLTPGILLFAALGSAAAIAFTQSSAPRTLVPFYIFCCLSAALLLTRGFLRMKLPTALKIAAWAIPFTGLLLMCLALPHCWANHQIDLKNSEAAVKAADTGILFYNIDYDREYTHSKINENGFFAETYIESYGLDPDEVTVIYESALLPGVTVDGRRTNRPAVEEDGEYFLPLRNIMELAGATVIYDDPGTRIEYREVVYTLLNGRFTWTDAGGNRHSYNTLSVDSYSAIHLPPVIFTDVFGLEVSFDRENMLFSLTTVQ